MKKGLFLTLVVLAVGILIASMVTAQSRAAEPYAVEPLTGAAEVPGPGDEDGLGTAAVTINTENGEVCLNVSVLANVGVPITAAHIHEGAVGISGPPVVNFLDAEDEDGLFNICVVDTDAAAIAANPAGYYVNLHNAGFPNGAVRGQLVTPSVETPTATEGTPVETVVATPTTSVPVAGDLVVNGGFENGLTGWTLKNSLGGDKVKTNKVDKVLAYEGSSAFKFKGFVGATAALQQVPDISALTFGVGDTLDVSLAVNAKKETADGKVKVVAKYADGLSDKFTADIVGTSNVYALITGQVLLTQSTVTKIKIQVKNTSPESKVYVDAVSVALVDQPDATPTAEGTVVATETAEGTVVATETATVEGTVVATETATVEGTVVATETATVESTVAATETATLVAPIPLP